MSVFFCFRNRKTGLYKGSFEDVKDPDKAYPKYVDGNSAFMHADEYYEGRVDAKMDFKDTYEICCIEDGVCIR